MEQSFTLEAGSKAFGDGSHPTTKMVLAAIEAIDPAAFAPRVACDMGAGSGVLSLAIAAKFGCKVAAVDIERQAVETLRANALHNGLAVIPFPAGGGLGWGCSKAMPDPAAPLPASPLRGEGSSGVIIPVHSDGFRHPQIESLAPFDLIVMNILAEPLLSLAADAAAQLDEGGVLILSGILAWQEEQIRAAYEGLGLELTSRLSAGDWLALIYQKP